MSRVPFDSMGNRLRPGDSVTFAGVDHRRRPTMNWGTIDETADDASKVRVVRTVQSGNRVHQEEPRRVWVDVAKVALLNPGEI